MKFASIFCLILLSLMISFSVQQDRFSNPADWRGLVTQDVLTVVTEKEVYNKYRCLGDAYCNAAIGRKCSFWGWCQDKSYNGPRLQ